MNNEYTNEQFYDEAYDQVNREQEDSIREEEWQHINNR